MSEGSDVNYWSLVTIVGPLVLLIVIGWLVVRSKKRGAEMNQADTEAGTRENYRREHEEHKDEPGSGLGPGN